MSTAPAPVLCPFLEINPPACDQTYADGLGSKYDNFQVVYSVVTVLLCVPAFYYTQKLARARGLLTGLAGDSQRRIFYLCSFICLTLLVRCADPAGWSKRLPIVVAGLALDLATAAVFSLVIQLVDDWAQLTLKVTGRKHLLVPMRRLFIALHAYAWLLLLVTSAFQNTQDAIWFWRALKLVLLAVLLFALSVTLTVVGTMIWRFLRKNEQKIGSRQNSTSNLRKAEDEEAPDGGGAGGSDRSLRGSVAIRKSSRASIASSSAKKKRSKVNRVLKLMVPMVVLAVITLLLQLATAQGLVDDKFTRSEPDDPPTTTGDIINEASFEAVQVIATVITIFFFRPRRHRNPDSETSANRGGSRSGRSSSRAGAGRPRQNTNTNTVSDVELGGGQGTTQSSNTREQ